RASEGRQSTSTVSRRRLRIRRRSRSLQPPHTPWSMRWSRAYSRHAVATGQPAQILRALSTPTPSLGKNVAGGYRRQLPSALHAVAASSVWGGGTIGSMFIAAAPCRDRTTGPTSKGVDALEDVRRCPTVPGAG